MEQRYDVRALITGLTLTAVPVAALDGGLAALAQRAGAAELARLGSGFVGYSLGLHVLTMLTLALVTVAVGGGLARAGARVAAVLVAVGITAGPMSVIAAPWRWSSAAEVGSVWWWQLAVAVPQLAILLLGMRWVARGLPASAPRDGRRDAAVFALVAVTGGTLQVLTSQGIPQEPNLLMLAGWALLGAGVTRLAAGGWWTPAAVAGLPLLAMYVAYHRPGGWPGVAGWEVFSQNPVLLAPVTPVVVLAGPVLLGLVRLASRLQTRPAGATAG